MKPDLSQVSELISACVHRNWELVEKHWSNCGVEVMLYGNSAFSLAFTRGGTHGSTHVMSATVEQRRAKDVICDEIEKALPGCVRIAKQSQTSILVEKPNSHEVLLAHMKSIHQE